MKCQSKSCLCYSMENGAVIIGITFMMSSAIALILEFGLIFQWNDMKIHFKNDTMRQCKFSLLRKSENLKYIIVYSNPSPNIIFHGMIFFLATEIMLSEGLLLHNLLFFTITTLFFSCLPFSDC